MHRYDSIGFNPDCGCHKKSHELSHCEKEYMKLMSHAPSAHFYSIEDFVCSFINKINAFMSKGFITLKDALSKFVTKDEFSNVITSVKASGTKPLNLSIGSSTAHEVIIIGNIDVATQTSSGIMSSQDKVDLDYLINNVNIKLVHIQDIEDIVIPDLI